MIAHEIKAKTTNSGGTIYKKPRINRINFQTSNNVLKSLYFTLYFFLVINEVKKIETFKTFCFSV